jgi:hypothetical protein
MSRIMSWFEDKTICMGCSEDEKEILKKLVECGLQPSDYEGIGYVPKIEDYF